MFNRFSLGTKAILSVLAILSICMVLMISMLVIQATHIAKKDAKVLIFNVAKRIANDYEAHINESLVALNFAQQTLSALIQETNDMNFERRAKNRLENTLDSNQWLENGFVYIKKKMP